MTAGVYLSEVPSLRSFFFGVVKQFCRFGISSNTKCSITPVDALHTTRSPPPHPHYLLYKYIPLYLFTQGRGEGGYRTSEKVRVRGALVHKRVRKYQHD
jgi:hypothetical protein